MTEERHPSTAHLLRFFEYKHLQKPFRYYSEECCKLAYHMADRIEDGPELTTGLRKLLEAKDCFVRAAIVGTK